MSSEFSLGRVAGDPLDSNCINEYLRLLGEGFHYSPVG